MKAQIIALVMTLLVASVGYFTYDTSSETTDEVEILSEYHWRDVNFTILWVRVMRTLQIGL